MQNFQKITKSIVFVLLSSTALVCSIFIFKRCSKGSPPPVQETITEIKKSRIDTIYVSIPYYIDSSKVDSIMFSSPIDTFAIFRDYFAKVHYSDTLRDTNYTLILSDIISKNRIESRQIYAEIKSYHTTTTLTMPRRHNFLLGVNGGYRSLKVEAFWLPRIPIAVSVGYDFVNTSPTLGIYYRIGK